jgi:hypothetical protein
MLRARWVISISWYNYPVTGMLANFLHSVRINHVIIDSPIVMESQVDAINVEVNGVNYSISNTSAKTSLNDWLRSQPGLKGDHFVSCPCQP